jgi:glycosyltransferase involved in cell wall biosynthesis
MNDTTKPLITTIIPTYRRPKLLRRAIKSVLNQTYLHFQVCVYDNASGDETAEVVSELAKKTLVKKTKKGRLLLVNKKN